MDDCIDMVAGSNATFLPGAAAGLHSQANGVLAALTLATLVFAAREHRNDASARSIFVLLPLIFVSSVGAAFEYAVASADRVCEREAISVLFAGSLYVFSVIAIVGVLRCLTVMNVSATDEGTVVSAVRLVFIVAAVAALLVYLSAFADVGTEFGLPHRWLDNVGLTLTALFSVALTVLSFGVRGSGTGFKSLLRTPTNRLRRRFARLSAGFLLVNLGMFSFVTPIDNWNVRAETVESIWLLRYAAVAFMGLLIGLVWTVTTPSEEVADGSDLVRPETGADSSARHNGVADDQSETAS